MPTVLRPGPYRFYFYSNETDEPPHVHIDRERATAKVWLTDVKLARNVGFSARELGILVRLVDEHRTELLEAWHGFFGDN